MARDPMPCGPAATLTRIAARDQFLGRQRQRIARQRPAQRAARRCRMRGRRHARLQNDGMPHCRTLVVHALERGLTCRITCVSTSGSSVCSKRRGLAACGMVIAGRHAWPAGSMASPVPIRQQSHHSASEACFPARPACLGSPICTTARVGACAKLTDETNNRRTGKKVRFGIWPLAPLTLEIRHHGLSQDRR
jgi:hypothetical protein